MKDVISLGIGEPDFVTPWKIRESSVFALERGVTSYTSNMGTPKLRQAISKYLEDRYQADYNPDTEVLITVGVSEALDLAIRAIVNPGDEVLYHEPCYVSYRPLIIFAGGTPVEIETQEADGFRLTLEALEAAVTPKTKALMLNYPNNPTGGTLRSEDVRMIADFAKKHDIVIISDEIYAELTYGREHAGFAGVEDIKDRLIYLHGFSKAWAMTGFRLGYACAPPELLDAMNKIHQYTMLCAPILSQEAAAEALTEADTAIAPMKEAYHQRCNFVHARLTEMGIHCPKPEGAFYAFPNIEEFGLDAHEFAMRFLREHNVAVVPGTAFGSCGKGHIRMSYATSMEKLKIAMERLEIFIGSLRAGA